MKQERGEGKSAVDPAEAAGRNPGDDAPPGTPGTGEAPCPGCNGSGKVGGGACPDCGGTGIVIQGVAGG